MSSISPPRVDGLAGLGRPTVDFGGPVRPAPAARTSGEWFGFSEWSGPAIGAGFQAQARANGGSIAEWSQAVLAPIVE